MSAELIKDKAAVVVRTQPCDTGRRPDSHGEGAMRIDDRR